MAKWKKDAVPRSLDNMKGEGWVPDDGNVFVERQARDKRRKPEDEWD